MGGSNLDGIPGSDLSGNQQHADVVTAEPCRIQQKTNIQRKMLLLHIFRAQMSPITYQ